MKKYKKILGFVLQVILVFIGGFLGCGIMFVQKHKIDPRQQGSLRLEGGRRPARSRALSGAAGPPVIEACRGLAGRRAGNQGLLAGPDAARHQRGFQRLPGAGRLVP